MSATGISYFPVTKLNSLSALSFSLHFFLPPPISLTPENAEVLTEISVLYLKINETQKAYDRLAEVVNIERKCTPKGLLALGAILQVSRHTPPLRLRLLSPFH